MKTPIALCSLAAVLALAGCGGGGETTTATGDSVAAAPSPGSPAASGQQGNSPQRSKNPGASGQGGAGGRAEGGNQAGRSTGAKAVPGDTSSSFTPPTHTDSGGGAAQFEQKGADNSIQESGAEADGSELAAAATALHGYLDARAAGAWSDACSYMAAPAAASLAQLSGGGEQASCPEVLASLSAGLPPASLREAAEADVAALRVDGDSGFLLFHGAHDSDYFIPMGRESGTWKVAAIAPSALL